ncbi:MAG: sulfotransferase family protein [Dolichospermum sp.]
MKKIDLVFRTVGERTTTAALELAQINIQPHKVHILENVKPFTKAVQRSLEIDYDCDYVVFVDADCLILEDMTSFLQHNTIPYIDCYVLDKFRGYVHCGVHITRIDIVRAMAKVKIDQNDPHYVVRPESRTRNLALQELNMLQCKEFKHFKILHDFFQFYQHIFVKQAIQELRTTNPKNYFQTKLKISQEDGLQQIDDQDLQVAHYGINYTRNRIKTDTKPEEISKFIEELPQIAIAELKRLKIAEKQPLSLAEALELVGNIEPYKRRGSQRMKVFGLGLEKTGIKSLTKALQMLNINVIQDHNDETTIEELRDGNYQLSLLNVCDGIIDITVAPYYAQLDTIYPDSKFILTVRDKESWLKSLEVQWNKEKEFDNNLVPESKMNLKKIKRSVVYGTHHFNVEQLSQTYDLHYKNVTNYFKDRPQSLLIINIAQGDGWEQLCPFFDLPIRNDPFPSVL